MLPNLLMAALQGVTRPFAKKGAPTLEQLERGEPIGLAQSMGYPQQSALMRQLYAEKAMQDPYYSIGGGMSAQRGKPNVFGMQQPTRGIPAQYAERLNPVTGMPETVMIDPGVSSVFCTYVENDKEIGNTYFELYDCNRFINGRFKIATESMEVFVKYIHKLNILNIFLP